MQRNVDTRTYDDDNPALYICDKSELDCLCFNCVECPCLEAHTEDECVGSELGCGTCRKIDNFVVEDIEQELNELYPTLIMEKMPIEMPPLPDTWTWGATEFWSSRLLEEAEPSLLMEKFSQNYKNNFVGSQNKSKSSLYPAIQQPRSVHR